MTAHPGSDKLLVFTRLVLTLLIWFTSAAILVCLAFIPAVAIWGSEITGGTGFNADALPWLAFLLAICAAMAVLGFLFFRDLRRIVDSVTDGDPFNPVNADRLFRMGWLSLGLQGLVIIATPIFFWFDAFPQKANVHHGETGFSVTSLVLALLLFVLARVFRVGAAMRDELEGTV